MKNLLTLMVVILLGVATYFGLFKGEYAQGNYYLTSALIIIVATKIKEEK